MFYVKEWSGFSKYTLGNSETQNNSVSWFLLYKLNLVFPLKNKTGEKHFFFSGLKKNELFIWELL